MGGALSGRCAATGGTGLWRGLSVTKGWVRAVALVVFFDLFVVGLLAYRAYTRQPPILDRVVADWTIELFVRLDTSKLFEENGAAGESALATTAGGSLDVSSLPRLIGQEPAPSRSSPGSQLPRWGRRGLPDRAIG